MNTNNKYISDDQNLLNTLRRFGILKSMKQYSRKLGYSETFLTSTHRQGRFFSPTCLLRISKDLQTIAHDSISVESAGLSHLSVVCIEEARKRAFV
jgi:hypothetical protein